MSKVTRFGLIVMISALLSACADTGRTIQELTRPRTLGWNSLTSGAGAVLEVADQVQSVADRLYSNPFDKFNRFNEPQDTDTQTCETDETALVTIYTTNSAAQAAIDVKLDGSPIGKLTTYFPDEGPACKTRSAAGVITLKVPAGQHTIEAVSPNLNWPGHTFEVERCGCMLLPLS